MSNIFQYKLLAILQIILLLFYAEFRGKFKELWDIFGKRLRLVICLTFQILRPKPQAGNMDPECVELITFSSCT